MTRLLTLDPELCWRMTLTIAHVGWIGLCIAFFAALGGRMWRGAAPERRYWLNFAALIVVGLSMPVTFAIVGPPEQVRIAAPARIVTGLKRTPARVVPPSTIAPLPLRTVERRVVTVLPTAAAPAWSRTDPHAFAPYVAIMYIMGVGVMMARLMIAVGGGLRLRRSATVVVEGPIWELVERQTKHLALHAAPTIGICARVATPVVLGLLQPMILLPAALATGLSAEELSVILAHELGHLRRYDHMFILLQRALEAVLFYHPAAWWLSRRIDLEREHCCDDLVVKAGHDRVVYSSALLHVAELSLAASAVQLVAPAFDGRRRSALRRRIERVLNVADEPAVKLKRPGVLALVLLALCAGTTAAAWLATGDEPKKEIAKSQGGPAKKADAPARASVVGRVVDTQGKPLSFVTVGMIKKNGYMMPPFWNFLQKWTLTDAAGRFRLPAVPPGVYEVLPVPGIEIIGKSTPADQLPPEFRKYADQPGTHRLPKPLPAAFARTLVQVADDGKPAVAEIKAVPHVTFTARFIDGADMPVNSRIDAYPIYVYENARGKGGPEWYGWFDDVPGHPDMMTALIPAASKNLSIQDDRDNVWWNWAPGTPRVRHAGIRLQKLDGDRTEIVVQRLKSNTLEIRLHSTNGKLPEEPDVHVSYPTPFGGDGGRIPDRVAPGVYRLDEMILPDRDCEVIVSADGYKTASTKPFQFREEGQAGVVEVTLTPGARTNSWELADAQPVVLKTPDGKPIPQPVVEQGPERAIACRALDRDTGKPVADAVVKVEIERRVKQNADDEQDVPESNVERESKTDADGRFTVSIPEKAISDHTPLATTSATVWIKHPKYVTYWDSIRPSELAEKPLSDTFPACRNAKLFPARRIVGRLLGPDGKPLRDVQLYQAAALHTRENGIFDLPRTDESGKFAFNAHVGTALKLEFRALQSSRKYYDVPADQTDLGDIRITPGIRVSGRVLDGKGAPVALVSVTTPAVPNPDAQPNFIETTDKDGRFQTDELPPGKYQAIVGDFSHDENGKNTHLYIRHAPGLYLPVPFEIREGQPVPELTLRPVPHVTFVAKLTTSRPRQKEPDDDGKPPTEAESEAYWREWGLQAASLSVKGIYKGAAWESHLKLLMDFSDEGKTCTIRVPKGLVDARLELMHPQRFQLGPSAPELFGAAYRLGKVDAEPPTITLRRYRDTTLKLVWKSEGGQPKCEAHYTREPAMRAAGVIFDVPLLPVTFEKNEAQLSVLPDEEIELTVPGAEPLRVKLSEGETRVVTLSAPASN